jgi:hypothetical protein
MPGILATTEKLYRQYAAGQSLTHLSKKYNVSRQAIHERFRRAGLRLRSPGGDFRRRPAVKVNEQEFTRMFVHQGLTLGQIAQRMNVPTDLLSRCVKRHPQLSKMRRGTALFPQLNTIKVGEYFLVPRTDRGKYDYTRFYTLGRRLGIRVSVTTESETEMRVTRVA